MGPRPDVRVIGGGVIGLTAAMKLAGAGVRVEVCDRGEFGREASWAGAGIIPPGNPERAVTEYDRLRARSSAGYATFAEELTATTGIDVGYRRCGGIEFLGPGEADLPARWRGEGIAVERLSPTGLTATEPNVHPPAKNAYELPGFAQVRNPWLVRALIVRCEQLAVKLRPNALVDPLDSTAGKTLIAAGAWTGELLGLPVRPVLGQIVLFRPAKTLLTRVLLAGKRYLVPRSDGRILAGATEEPEAGFEKRNTTSGVNGLITFARQLVPALETATVETTWAGLRPGSPDGMPFIGPVPGWPNLFVAAGHYRAGIQLAPATADLICDLIFGRPTTDAFRLDRDTTAPVSFAFRS